MLLAASCCILAAQDLSTVPNPVDSDSYSVIYAGRLFGYYRVPEVQSLVPEVQSRKPAEDCPAATISSEKTPEAAKFVEGISKAQEGAKGLTLLLATGNNFAPFLLSRQMWIPSEGSLQEKERYRGSAGAWVPEKDNVDIETLNGGGSIPMDNVGCFIRQAGFDAIVPGEFDFYFGPTRLRQLAHFLSNGKGAFAGLRTTKMLGVNLYLKTRVIATAVSRRPRLQTRDLRTAR